MKNMNIYIYIYYLKDKSDNPTSIYLFGKNFSNVSCDGGCDFLIAS